MGEVWLAEDTRLQRRVALKMVRAAAAADTASRERLMREARAAAALNHPHIATVHDVLEEQGEVVIVFEYVEGETLHARIARERLPVPEAVDIATQIARALAAAHAHGIVHRDLKPANVIIGADRHVKVLDFGIARILAVGVTQTTAAAPPVTASGMGFIGTASYAAPEQMVSSAVDARADLYALGVVLFEMLSGKRPFPGSDPVQLATSKLSTDAPLVSSTGQLVPPDLEQLVAMLLERDRDRRPASAQDVVLLLRDISGEPSTVRLSSLRPRRLWAPLAVSMLIALLAGYGLWQWPLRPAPGSSTAPVIAVVPLENVSGDASKDFVAAGIAESLITSLAALRSITVLSRAAVVDARTRASDSRKLIQDLGATYLVEGSIQESGGVYRISVNLIRPDRSIVWGDAVQGATQDIFDLQSRLAVKVVDALRVEVTPTDRQRMNAPITASAVALEKYWQGRALFDRRDVKSNLDSAIAAYESAIAIDPRFALAHAALGEAYWVKYNDTREPALATRATEEGYAALRIDANAAAVRYSLAVTLAGTGQLDEAVAELRQALVLQPNYDDARRQLGQVLATQGHIEEAITEFNNAIAARPDAWINYSALGRSLYSAGRHKEAIAAFEKVTQLQPDNALGFQQLGTALQQTADYDRAVESYKKALAIRPVAQVYSNLGALYHLRHDYQAAVEAYRHAIELRPNSAATHRNLGDALGKLGERQQAMAAYQTAVKLVDADLRVNPRDAVTIASSAVYLAKVGRLDEAKERLRNAVQLAPRDNVVCHRAAIVNVLTGDRPAALESIRLAIQNGYSKTSIAEDDEFESLKNDEQFKRLIAP